MKNLNKKELTYIVVIFILSLIPNIIKTDYLASIIGGTLGTIFGTGIMGFMLLGIVSIFGVTFTRERFYKFTMILSLMLLIGSLYNLIIK